MPKHILIVDDDPVQRRLLEAMVTKFGYLTTTLNDGDQCIEMIDASKSNLPDLIILDLGMPGLDGMGVLEILRDKQIRIPVIVQTAKGGIETVVSAMRAGAYDFAVKPVSPERLKVAINNALSMGNMRAEMQRIRKTAACSLTFEDIMSNSPAMEKVKKLGRKAASSNIAVLIEGESGVGKELIARAIQGSSDRAGAKLVTVNCGAIPENLIESTLFGHEKGSFTGATDRHKGKFQEADGGTLFLDEVGELPPAAQVKLLRALQEGEVDPIGAKKPVKVDFRLISATNKALLDETKGDNFREDLYYRLSVFPIWMPPLRERIEDIPLLAENFLSRFGLEEGRGHIKSISGEAVQLLIGYDWPGNVRQLENMIFRAVILCETDQLEVVDFPQVAARCKPDEVEVIAENLSEKADYQPHSVPETECVVEEEVNKQRDFVNEQGEIRELEDIESEMIRFAVELYNGKMTEVASRLGIGRSTLYRRLKELGIDEDLTPHTASQTEPQIEAELGVKSR